MRLILIFILFFTSVAASVTPALAGFDPIDGTYDAHVAAGGQVYRVPVEVAQGKVTTIIWPNGARMQLKEARIRDGKSIAQNAEGISFTINISDLEYKYDDSDEFRDRTDKNIFDDE